MNSNIIRRNHHFVRGMVVFAILLIGLSWNSRGAADPSAAPPMRAMWVYETEDLLDSPSARADLFQFCQPRRITDLFLQTRFEAKAKAGPYQIADAAKMRSFLREATKLGLRIHALTGDPAWGLTENHEKALGRVEALAAFQTGGAGERFAGLHFDIEPHAAPEWKTASDEEKRRRLTQFVEVNAKTVELLHDRAPGTLYGADIAFWLDKANANGTPAYPVTFRGVTKDATKHLLDMVDNLGLMSYRGKVEGANGIISLVGKSIAYADTAKGHVFVGVKMANIGPKMESFFGSTEQQMNAEVSKIDETYGPHRGYAGLAYFMYTAYKAMPK